MEKNTTKAKQRAYFVCVCTVQTKYSEEKDERKRNGKNSQKTCKAIVQWFWRVFEDHNLA